eukprot:1643665-Alexandrium_andersonii.AAC.1
MRAAADADAEGSGEAVLSTGRGTAGGPAVRDAYGPPAAGADPKSTSSSAVARMAGRESSVCFMSGHDVR